MVFAFGFTVAGLALLLVAGLEAGLARFGRGLPLMDGRRTALVAASATLMAFGLLLLPVIAGIRALL